MFLCFRGRNCWPIFFKFGTDIPTLDIRMTVIGNYIRQNGAGLQYRDISKRCRTTYIFLFDHSPRRTPALPLTNQKCHFEAFHGMGSNFLEFFADEIMGLRFVLGCNQTLRSRKGLPLCINTTQAN